MWTIEEKARSKMITTTINWAAITDLTGWAKTQLRSDVLAARRRLRRQGCTPLPMLAHGAGHYTLPYRNADGSHGYITLR